MRFLALFFLAASPALAQSTSHPIAGYVDGLAASSDGSYTVGGWACARNSAAPIQTHVYLGAAAGQPGATFFGQVTASDPVTDPNIAAACGTPGFSGYRYHFALSKADQLRFAGQAIYVHGIDPFPGYANDAVAGSGGFTVPRARLRLSEVAPDGADLTIPATADVTIDRDVTARRLTVRGKLLCPEFGAFTLNAQALVVDGAQAAFTCGTPQARFAGRLAIELRAGLDLGAMAGSQAFVVQNGATLQLIGANKNLNWLRLDQTAPAGATSIHLSGPVNWTAGDRIVIAPTGLDPSEGEERTIESVDPDLRTLRFAPPLRHSHWGVLQAYTAHGKTYQLDERAEVADLTRNIKIYGTITAGLGDDEAAFDGRGGHVMVMHGGIARIDGVEFYRMGRMGEMGRYPFHWHREGDVTGQYIMNSAIHHSYQRCVTVHGTNNARVMNNSCYDHFGHGYFLEDGNETGNEFNQNLGIWTRTPPAERLLLASDADRGNVQRFAGPATFWQSNPNNFFIANAAAGSEGSGYWLSFVPRLACTPQLCDYVDSDAAANVFPAKTGFGLFSYNSQHTAIVGFAIDGSASGALTGNPNNAHDRKIELTHYYPPFAPVFWHNSLTKNVLTGAYLRGDAMSFVDSIFADNIAVSVFFAYDHAVRDSAIIGYSGNHTEQDFAYHLALFSGIRYPGAHGQPPAGVWLYDGPLHLTNVDFFGFSTAPVSYRGYDFTEVPLRSIGGTDQRINTVQGLTFTPEPIKRFEVGETFWSDSLFTAGVHDVDGSLLGVADSLMVVDVPFNRSPNCQSVPGTGALRCVNQRRGQLNFAYLDGMVRVLGRFQMTRSDGAVAAARVGRELFVDDPSVYFVKVGVILGEGYQYEVQPEIGHANFADAEFIFRTSAMGELSPVIKFVGAGSGCVIANAQNVRGMAGLQMANATSYFTSNQDLYAVFKTELYEDFAVRGDSRPFLARIRLQCQQTDLQQTRTAARVFDAAWYLNHYPDLKAAYGNDLDAATRHWTAYGIREGRQGCAAFDARRYLALYSDVANYYGATNYPQAVDHYLSNGFAEGRRGL